MSKASQGSSVPPGASKQFQALVKAIGESGNNHEEERIIRQEVKVLARALKEPNIAPRQMKEYLIRLMYCEMLGHEVPFGYIHAVKFAQHTTLMEKRVGYLAVSVLLHENHELILLLVNTIQRDLKSTNVVEICMALTAICRLINEDMIPALLPMVEAKLSHNREIVRKKAVLALHRFQSRSPSSVAHLQDHVRRALCDKDPGVMAASLNLFHDMSLTDPTRFKDLTPSFVSILKQLVEQRLPRDFDYHRVPAPWVQIKLLQILAILGQDDQSASEAMYEVIRECLRRADIQSSAAYAVLYECIRTVTSIYPSPQLVELAARSVGRFLRSGNNNLKYLGITALSSIVQVNPIYASEHQLVVIDCLDDPDETLKRKTLDLLCKMTNPANVTVITEKLISYLSSTVDRYLRKDLVPRIIQLAERFAPDNMWFLETMNSLFEIGGDLVQPDVAHNLMRLIAEGTEDEQVDQGLRVFAAETYIDMLETPNLPDVLVQTMSWVVGEYAYLATEYDQAVVLEMVASLLERKFTDDLETKSWVITAITKLVAQTGMYPDALQHVIARHSASVSTDVQQRCQELGSLVQNPSTMKAVLPLDASCEDIDVDEDLCFLNGFVQNALAQGARPYNPPVVEVPVAKAEPLQIKSSGFIFDAYDAPTEPTHLQHKEPLAASGPGDAPTLSSSGGAPSASSGQGLGGPSDGLKVASRRWGKSGDLQKQPAPTAAPAASTTSSSSSAGIFSQPAASKPAAPAAPIDPSQPPSLHVYQPGGGSTTSSSSSAAPARYEEPEDPEEARKKQLASALFASAPTTTRAAGRTSRARKGAGATASAGWSQNSSGASQGGASQGNLLGDLMGSGISAPSSAPAGGSSGLDLLGLDLGGSSSTDSVPAVPPPSYSAQGPDLLGGSLMGGGDSLLGGLDGFGGLGGSSMTQPAPAPAPTQTPLAAASQPMFDLLGGLGGETPATSSAAASGLMSAAAPAAAAAQPSVDLLGGDLLGGPVSPSPAASAMPSMSGLSLEEDGTDIPASLKQFDYSEAGVELSRDPHLAVQCARVWKPEGLVVVLYLTNKDQTRHLSGVVTRLDIPAGVTRVPTSGFADDFNDNQCTDNIRPGGTARHVLSFSTQAPSSGLSLKGQVTYTDPQLSVKNVYFSQSFNAGDFLRARAIDTDRFGALWSSTSGERKQKISGSSIKTPEDFMACSESEIHAHPVQIIGQEAILCAQVLQFVDSTCLIHAKLSATGIEITVRSPATQFSEAVMRHYASVLKF
eukprot:m.486657 g.486657  ORF g.486657 m.486657 type:complete len:1260 (-) comp24542_c0_seq1:51-3830(-)